MKTVENIAEEAIKACALDVKVTWVSNYRYPIRKCSNLTPVIGHPRDRALVNNGNRREWSLIHICYLPAGRSVLGKTVPKVLSTARGRRPRAVSKAEGTVFPNTDRPRPANNVFIIFFRRVLCKQFLCGIFTAAIFKPGARGRLTFRNIGTQGVQEVANGAYRSIVKP